MNVLNQLIESRFAIYNGDSVEVLKGLPDDSVHYSIFSPPFSSLYVYSNSDRDMGNSSTDIEFWQHFKYLIAELYRVIMPGRLVSVHCMDLPLTKSRDGVIGMKDFPGDIIRTFQDAGFVMHSRVTIWKDLRPIQFCLIKSKNTIRSLYIAIKYGADMLILYGPISAKRIR